MIQSCVIGKKNELHIELLKYVCQTNLSAGKDGRTEDNHCRVSGDSMTLELGTK